MKTVYANIISGLSYTQGNDIADQCSYSFFQSQLNDLFDGEICCECNDDQIEELEKTFGAIK
jgi:hypothetical protein